MHHITFAPYSRVGWDSLNSLPALLEAWNSKSIRIVTDPVLQKIGIVEKILSPLRDIGCDVDVYTDVEPEPSLACAERLVAFGRSNPVDCIIGLGGGSALDLAKLAAVLPANGGVVAEYLNLTGHRKPEVRGVRKVLVPTTSGTGSEVTNISVLSLGRTKDVVTDDALLADCAIVDPSLTVTVPSRVTAATGVDALTHAIEAYLSVHANPVTDGLAIQAIRLITSSLETAVAKGDDAGAREAMSYGSYLAGLAFFNAGVGGVHALAYPLGGQFHMPHGESNAVLLPHVMRYIRRACEGRLADIWHAWLPRREVLHPERMTISEAAQHCIVAMENLVRNVGLPDSISAYSIPEAALDSLTDDAIQQTRLLSRSPMTLGVREIREIYQMAYSGIQH